VFGQVTRKGLIAGMAVMAVVATQLAGTAVASGGKGPTRYTLANRCWALVLARNREPVTAIGNHYEVNGKRAPAAFYLKPTRLGTYLVYDQDGRLMAAGRSGHVGRSDHPGRRAEWAPKRARHRTFDLVTPRDDRHLSVSKAGHLSEKHVTAHSSFRFRRAHGCKLYPEAKADAAGHSFKDTTPKGTVKGFVDAHLHITADMRAGGRVIDGRAFAPFGATRALGGDARNHGPDGSLDVTGNLLHTGSPFGTHDVDGWPTFAGWPVHDTITHQQTYYMWLKRAWKSP
jgi:hypothetical protein